MYRKFFNFNYSKCKSLFTLLFYAVNSYFVFFYILLWQSNPVYSSRQTFWIFLFIFAVFLYKFIFAMLLYIAIYVVCNNGEAKNQMNQSACVQFVQKRKTFYEKFLILITMYLFKKYLFLYHLCRYIMYIFE